MNKEAYTRLGEVLIDELLLRAGLAQKSSEPTTVSLNFTVEADAESEQVLLRCERINNTPLELRFPIRSD